MQERKQEFYDCYLDSFKTNVFKIFEATKKAVELFNSFSERIETLFNILQCAIGNLGKAFS